MLESYFELTLLVHQTMELTITTDVVLIRGWNITTGFVGFRGFAGGQIRIKKF